MSISPGDLFGRWMVLNRVKGKRQKALCRCSCGTEREVYIPDLIRGRSTACGYCYGAGWFLRLRHIDQKTRWRIQCKVANAIARCTDPDHERYDDWGGRGIRVHQPWVDDPVSFGEYLVTLPGFDIESMVLDRKDNEGHYEPGNLQFVTTSESNRNRRGSIPRDAKDRAVRMYLSGGWSYSRLSKETGISAGEIHRCVKKAVANA